MMSQNPSVQDLTTVLTRRLDFTPDDLASNERGQLSERQKVSLTAALKTMAPMFSLGCRRILWGLLLVAFVIPLGAMLFLVGGAVVGAFGINLEALIILGFVLLFVLCTFLWAMINFALNRNSNSIIQALRTSPDNAVIMSATGASQGFAIRGKVAWVYYINIGGTHLQVVDPQQFSAFQKGVNYQVFYLDIKPLPYLLSAQVIAGT